MKLCRFFLFYFFIYILIIFLSFVSLDSWNIHISQGLVERRSSSFLSPQFSIWINFSFVVLVQRREKTSLNENKKSKARSFREMKKFIKNHIIFHKQQDRSHLFALLLLTSLLIMKNSSSNSYLSVFCTMPLALD